MIPAGETTVQAAVEQAKALASQGRIAQALERLEPFATARQTPWQVLSVYADLLKRSGRLAQSIEVSRRLVEVRPQSIPARHNLASSLGDIGRPLEAEATCRQAMALGGDAPETWMVLARALQAQNRFDESEAAYEAALQRRPLYPDALREWSQLIWMRTGDVAKASALLDRMIAASPNLSVLYQIKARLLEYAGEAREAYEAVTAGPMDAASELTAAQAMLRQDPAKALTHAERARVKAGVAPLPILGVQAECLLALGKPEAALAHIEEMRRLAPDNQYALALSATGWRMSRDARYAALYDYSKMVRAYQLETPPGWASLTAYLEDLGQALNRLHRLKAHPVGQSLRGGSQTTTQLTQVDDAAVAAFFEAVDRPIRDYMSALGSGDDPLRRRNTGCYRVQGSWSVRLQPNGYHTDHIHSEGWLSSACHIALPASVGEGGREGWLRFGAPPGLPNLEAEHYVQPRPGALVLFPSYMWHGTVPFGGDASRLTLAFDVVPA